jgi:hypothetical protein
MRTKEHFPAVGESMRKDISITLPAELALQEFQKNPEAVHIFDGVRFDKDIDFLREHIRDLLVI